MNPLVAIAGVFILSRVITFAAVDFAEFPGWDALETSSDVLVVRCLQTPDPYNKVTTNGIHVDPVDGLIASDIEVVSVLKGEEKPGRATVISQYWPSQGEYYLIFAIYFGGHYQAVDASRIVPLGHFFSTSLIKGSTLDQKVRSILQYRLDLLNDELKQGQEEKKRLEEGLTGTNAASSVKTNGSRLNGK